MFVELFIFARAKCKRDVLCPTQCGSHMEPPELTINIANSSVFVFVHCAVECECGRPAGRPI